MAKPGQSTYNPPGLDTLALVTGGGNAVNGVKAYEVRKLFCIYNNLDTPWLLSDGVRKTFMLNGIWKDPITQLAGFAAIAQLPARPGQYWKIKWNYRYEIAPKNSETNHFTTLGIRITNPTGGTEEYTEWFDDSLGLQHSGQIEVVVPVQTSTTRRLDQHSGWTRFSCFGSCTATGTTSEVFLLPFNEIILELWNGPLPNSNRLKNAGNPALLTDARFEVAPENF